MVNHFLHVSQNGCYMAAFELLLLLLAAWSVVNMLNSWFLGTCLFTVFPSSNAKNVYWRDYDGKEPAWQYRGSATEAGFWFEQTQNATAIMQDTYWNGTYWPSTIQWIGALVDTIFTTTQRTFTDGLDYYGVDVTGASTSSAEIQNDIQKYYSQIESYFGGEEVNDIFGQAYDDAQWVVLEWLEVIKFINQYEAYARSGLGQEDVARYAHRAHIFYNIVQDKFDTSLCEGGLTWNPALDVYKNAITNELFISSSMQMYFWFPGDSNPDPYPTPSFTQETNRTLPPLPALGAQEPLFLENAKQTWNWMKTHNFTNDQGLIVDGFHISEGQTTCDERDEMVYTYNQAVMLDGLRGLWEATGDTTYLEDAYKLIETVINATGWHSSGYDQPGQWAGLGRNGILEDYCDAPANCTQDQTIFKGAYFEHLSLFCEDLPTDIPLVAGVSKLASKDLASSHRSICDTYTPWVQHNAYAALSTVDEFGLFGQWWGATYLNQTQTPSPKYTQPKPPGSGDIWNQPELLNRAPWKCSGRHGCNKHHNKSGLSRRARSRPRMERRQFPDPVRTVETQAQGLSVLRAAAQLTMKR